VQNQKPPAVLSSRKKNERSVEKRWPEHWTPEQAATCARARTEEKETKVLC
jgi:hypothetical protein